MPRPRSRSGWGLGPPPAPRTRPRGGRRPTRAPSSAAGARIAARGGATPRRAYELGAELEADWSHATLWFGDERCVPPDDEHSNFGMARRALLSRLRAGAGA